MGGSTARTWFRPEPPLLFDTEPQKHTRAPQPGQEETRWLAHLGHVGGLLTGLALGAVLAKHLTAPPEVRDGWWRGVFVAALVILLAAYVYVRHSTGIIAPS